MGIGSSDGRFQRIIAAALLLAGLTIVLPAAAEDLQLQVGQSSRKLLARERDGNSYYPLDQIALHLGLETQERGGLLRVSGPRGSLHLTADRPLVRFEDQYLLLSQPVWQRSRGEWYVPEDFLPRAASLVLDGKLEETSPHGYKLDLLDENQVQVEIVNYPDHVSIVFRPARVSPIQVREMGRLVEVEFEQLRVTPSISSTSPDRALVESVRFDSGDVFGRFEIIKGPSYHSYRAYNLADPLRKVIDIYPQPQVAAVDAPEPTAVFDPVVPKDEPLYDIAEDVREFTQPRYQRALIIDPGHGGDNYGVHPSANLLEKDFMLDIGTRLGRRLETTPHKVLLTRSRDINLSLERRSSIANTNRSRAFVSLHLGASSHGELSGPVVYVHRYSNSEPFRRGGLRAWEEGQRGYLKESRELAQRLQAALNQLYGAGNSVGEAPLEVLSPVMAPAVVVELGFLTNSGDRDRLEDPEFKEEVARVISETLLEWL